MEEEIEEDKVNGEVTLPEKDTPAPEEAPEELPQKELSPRERWAKRLQDSYPDDDFAEEDKFYTGLDKYAEERDNRIKTFQEQNDKLIDAFTKDPKVGELFSQLVDGGDVLGSLIDVYGNDIKEAINSPEYIDKIKEKVAVAQAIELEQNTNAEKYMAGLDSFMGDKGMSDEEKDSFMQSISDLADNIFLFKFTPEVMEQLYKGLKYEEDIAEAETAGEVRGRNEKIELQKKDLSDGVPQLESTVGGKSSPKYSDPQSIWERGKK
ncbi:MAG: hypothetical protein RR383_08560 [Muribaculaceae bacterium]